MESPFSYKATKDSTVFIFYQGRRVTTLAGRKAAAFLSGIVDADDHAAQLLMARATGQFKRGNEPRAT